MLCDICHTREAKIVYTEIINGQKREQHLCEACAAEQTLAIKDKMGNEIPIGSILSGILQNFANGITSKSANEPVCMRCGMTASELVKQGRLGCPECYNAFSMILDKNLRTTQGYVEHHGKEPLNARHIKIEAALLPVRTAADVMKEATDEIARRNMNTVKSVKPVKSAKPADEGDINQKTETAGGKNDKEKRIEELRQQMSKAVKEEDYEEAARLRDLIYGMEGKE